MKTKYPVFFIILAALVFALGCAKNANFNNEETKAFTDELKDEYSEISHINFKIQDVTLIINVILDEKASEAKRKEIFDSTKNFILEESVLKAVNEKISEIKCPMLSKIHIIIYGPDMEYKYTSSYWSKYQHIDNFNQWVEQDCRNDKKQSWMTRNSN